MRHIRITKVVNMMKTLALSKVEKTYGRLVHVAG